MKEPASPFHAGDPESLSRLLQLGFEDAPEGVPTDPAPSERIGRVIAGYELLRELGRGGAGVVYLARQTVLQRFVAVKILGAHLFRDRASRLRFQREAELVASLQHPQIVRIYEFGVWEELPFYSMQYIEGTNLKERIRANVLPWQQAAMWAASVAETVHFAHRKGVLHRDLKPQNILIDLDEQLHLADFGLARRIEETHGITMTGTVVGTPHYIAPEVLSSSGREVSATSDIYAVGAFLYEMLTGIPPYGGNNLSEITENIRRLDPVPPSRIRSGIPKRLEVICLKALRKRPHHRYSDAHELAEALKSSLGDHALLIPPSGTAGRSPPRRSVRIGVTISLVVGLAFLLLGGLIYSKRATVQPSQGMEDTSFADIEKLTRQGKILEAAQEAQSWADRTPEDPQPFRWLAALDVAQLNLQSAQAHWAALSKFGEPSALDQKIGQVIFCYEWEESRIPDAQEDRSFRAALVGDLGKLDDPVISSVAAYLANQSSPEFPPVILPIDPNAPGVVRILPGDHSVVLSSWIADPEGWTCSLPRDQSDTLKIPLAKPCIDIDFSMTFTGSNDVDMGVYTTKTIIPNLFQDYLACLGAWDGGRSVLRLFGREVDVSTQRLPGAGEHKMQLSRRSGWIVVLLDAQPVLAHRDPDPLVAIDKLAVWGGYGGNQKVYDLSYRLGVTASAQSSSPH